MVPPIKLKALRRTIVSDIDITPYKHIMSADLVEVNGDLAVFVFNGDIMAWKDHIKLSNLKSVLEELDKEISNKAKLQ